MRSLIYRVIAKSREKPKAGSTRLEVCFQGSEPKRKCYTFVEIQAVDNTARNSIEYEARIYPRKYRKKSRASIISRRGWSP